MRYILETKTQKGEELLAGLLDNNSKNFTLIDSYEPKERILAQVEKLGLALREYKKGGISWDVMKYYLRGKGLPQQTIDAVLGDVTEFFIKVGILEQE